MKLPVVHPSRGEALAQYRSVQAAYASLKSAMTALQDALDADLKERVPVMAMRVDDLARDFEALAAISGHCAASRGTSAQSLAGTFLDEVRQSANPRLDIPEALFCLRLRSTHRYHRWRLDSGFASYQRRTILLAVALCLMGSAILWAAFKASLYVRQEIRLASESTFFVDLVTVDGPSVVPHLKTGGLKGLERSGEISWRWGEGPKTLVAFVLHKARPVTVRLEVFNPIDGQVLRINGNGKRFEFSLGASVPWMTGFKQLEFSFDGVPGVNTLHVEYSDWNRGESAFAPSDPSPYAVAYTHFIMDTRDGKNVDTPYPAAR